MRRGGEPREDRPRRGDQVDVAVATAQQGEDRFAERIGVRPWSERE